MYLQRILCAYGDDVVLVVTQLAAPAAALADPLDEARLVRALDRAGAAARAQQLPLQGERQREVRRRPWSLSEGGVGGVGGWPLESRLWAIWGRSGHATYTRPQAFS